MIISNLSIHGQRRVRYKVKSVTGRDWRILLGAIWDVKVINTRWIWQKATKRGNHAAQQEIESNKIKFVWKFEDSKSEKSCPCLRVHHFPVHRASLVKLKQTTGMTD